MTIQMSNMEHGQGGLVQGLEADGSIRRRLLDLGLVPGTRIERVLASPAGDPVCYRIRGALIALRRHDASQVMITV